MGKNILKEKLKSKKITVRNLASKLKINPCTIFRKFKDLNKFTIGEVLAISEILELSHEECIKIFL